MRTAGQQGALERPTNLGQPVEALVEGTVEQESLDALPSRSVPTLVAKPVIEQGRIHKPLVRWHGESDKAAMATIASALLEGGRRIVDLALPPRCPGCGAIVDSLHSFCGPCWRQIEWLGQGGCAACGLPLEGTDIETCAACLASPPLIARSRAAVAYGDITRTLPLRLKYSRKVALAKTMARYMSALVDADIENGLLAPVPLHRGRLWSRGFNQSALLARELSRHCGIPHDPRSLKRIKRTAPLKGMGSRQRQMEVRGAFAVTDRTRIEGGTVVLVDDVLTSGSTAQACAKALIRAGALRVELICWARVVRPAQFMR